MEHVRYVKNHPVEAGYEYWRLRSEGFQPAAGFVTLYQILSLSGTRCDRVYLSTDR